ncbi:MAG: DUF2252 family protein [Polyangiaceae bacterium]
MVAPDPVRYADRQLTRDVAATKSFPLLLPRKLTRMAASPFGYLRGAAPLYYELLAEHPELAEGPSGEGWLVGDAHLENFGAFRTADKDGAEAVVFDVNDFDESVIGPFRWDVVRLLTSVILGGRGLGSNGQQSVQLCHSLLDGYVATLCDGQVPKHAPLAVQALLAKVSSRDRKMLLDQRTERVGHRRRFQRGPRYEELDPEIVPKARAAFEQYVERLDPDKRVVRDHFAIEDLAFRIAGTGSLGGLRIAVLTLGKGDIDSRWVFDMKVEGVPSAQALAPQTQVPAERVLMATRACLPNPPRMAGTTELDGLSMFVRRLLPQEDKLDLTRVAATELPELARYLGTLLGSVHRRGARSLPSSRWDDAALSALTERAIVVAGVHEAAYLAMCRTLPTT